MRCTPSGNSAVPERAPLEPFSLSKTMTKMKNLHRWLVVILYASAMAWVESAVVYYLRTMIGRLEPYQPDPLPVIGRLGPVELARELATLIMLLTVGILAGRSWRERLGYAVVAFGAWGRPGCAPARSG